MQAIEIASGGIVGVETGFIHPSIAQSEEAKKRAIELLREELPELPTYSFLESFAPDLVIEPLSQPGSPNHERDHDGHVLVLSVLYLLRLRERGLDISDDDIKAIAWTSVYHDSKRENDTYDPLHGERAARAIEQDTSGVYRIPERLIPLVCRIIREHVPDDTSSMHPLSRLFKDIDNMLWIRSEDFDSNYLRSEDAKDMLPIAHALLEETKKIRFQEKDGFIVVLNAAERLGLIRFV